MAEPHDDLPARAVFELEIEELAGRSRVGRLLGAITVNLLTLGAGPTEVGGRRLVSRERDTDDVMATWSEQSFDESHVLFSRIRDDLAELSADAFAERWIEGQSS